MEVKMTERQALLYEARKKKLKEKKRLKKEGISEVVDKPDYKLIALIWDGGFSSIEMKQNGAIGFDIIFINYYDMNKRKKK